MTQREREKLDPLIRAADNMAVILENISAVKKALEFCMVTERSVWLLKLISTKRRHR